MTNFEKIKQVANEMDEAGMAEQISNSSRRCQFCTEYYLNCDGKCEQHICKWLKKEVNEDD